jgi:signal transduction histidine kinase
VPEFVKAGLKAVATAPLKLGGRVRGAIGVMDTGSGRKFDQEDLDILSIISTQAAAAIDNARLYEELARSAAKLEERVRERTEALSRMFQESERKSRELSEANLKLREVDRLKSEFLANMSHELRTPLNSIIGFSKLILDGLDGKINEEQTRDLEIVHTNAQELLRLIDDLLNLAKIEAGRASVSLQPEDPAEVVSEVMMSFRSAAAEKHLELVFAPPAAVRAVLMDRGKIRQVLMNLLGNAIKFTETGSVGVSFTQSADGTIFSVVDTGIGLKPDQTDVVFDRFHQAAADLADAEGVGLGLTISKRFIEMHGGRIWVESEYGSGSKFSFIIPERLG